MPKIVSKLLSIAPLVLLAFPATAQTLEELRARRTALERELAAVNEAISKRENEPSASAASKKTWYLGAFDFSIDSAGGVEPYIVFQNPNAATPIKYIDVRDNREPAFHRTVDERGWREAG